MGDSPHIYRPTPRRPFDISTDYSMPPSPSPENQNAELHLSSSRSDLSPPSRTRSVLNLTSSTLLGIYSPTGGNHDLHGTPENTANTPWGTGAQTPSHRRSTDEAYPPQLSSLQWNGQTQKPQTQPRNIPRRKGFRGYYLPLLLRGVLLFAFGVAYGSIITQLQKPTSVTVSVAHLSTKPTIFHLAWGLSGVLLGTALPYLDSLWHTPANHPSSPPRPIHPSSSSFPTEPPLEWFPTIRSIGVFVGIAFAVRKLPWQSTLQVSLTLALANPVLWYLIDRSKAGFAFSTAVGILGTCVLLAVNPDAVPLPTGLGVGAGGVQDAVSERVGVFTWMASVLFCTSVCFGAIGRKVQA